MISLPFYDKILLLIIKGNSVKVGNIKKYLLLLIGFWLICGLLAILFLQLPYYDWTNYHHYNSWAFFNNRYDLDFLAANHRTYFIPYVDLLQYIFIEKLNEHPLLFLFIESFDDAVILLLTYMIGEILFNVPLRQKIFFNIYNIFFVAFSPIFILLSNFSMNDMRVAIFILLSFYILLKNLFETDKKGRFRNIFLGGVVLGVALALKLTSIVYVLTLSAIILLMFKRIPNPFKTFGLFCSGVIFSFIIVSGHWYYNMYKHFDNPFLPYFNDVFRSEYSNFTNFVHEDFAHVKARNIIEFIFFPFFISGEHTFGNSEYSFDPRFAVMFVIFLFIIPFLVYLDKLKKQTIFCDLISVNNLWFLILYINISYYINIYFFGTYRYIISSSVLFGFIAIVFAYALFSSYREKPKFISVFLILLLLSVYSYTNFGKSKYKLSNIFDVHNIISVEDAGIKDNSYVFVFSTLMSYVIPYQNPNAHYILIIIPPEVDYVSSKFFRKGDLIFHTQALYSKYLKQKISEIMNSNANVYFMCFAAKGTYNMYKNALDYYSGKQRHIMGCNNLHSYIFGIPRRKMKVCEYN